MRKISASLTTLVVALLGAGVLSAPALATTETPKLYASANVECGKVTITFVNNTNWDFSGDVRVNDADGVDDEATSLPPIANGPNASQPFGQRYEKVTVPANGTETWSKTFAEDSGTHKVAYRIFRRPENDYYVNWQETSVSTDCLPGADPVIEFTNPTCLEKKLTAKVTNPEGNQEDIKVKFNGDRRLTVTPGNAVEKFVTKGQIKVYINNKFVEKRSWLRPFCVPQVVLVPATCEDANATVTITNTSSWAPVRVKLNGEWITVQAGETHNHVFTSGSVTVNRKSFDYVTPENCPTPTPTIEPTTTPTTEPTVVPTTPSPPVNVSGNLPLTGDSPNKLISLLLIGASMVTLGGLGIFYAWYRNRRTVLA